MDIVEVLINAGGSNSLLYNSKDDRSTGLSIVQMAGSYVISVALRDLIWDQFVPLAVFPPSKPDIFC